MPKSSATNYRRLPPNFASKPTRAIPLRPAAQLLAGCHEPGHYDGGMVATITVEG
jgi:hypothetical protein